MIFKQTHHLIPERKWQTRRPVKPGEYAIMSIADPTKIFSVIGANGRLKWQVGKDYAIQPGRGQKAVGRTPPIKAIRRQRLQEIKPFDMRAEMGCSNDDPNRFAIYLLPKFIDLWNSLYPKEYDWKSNPDVWVLDWAEKGGQ